MIVQLVTYATRLSEDAVLRTIEERAPRYRELPGLLQKLYIYEPAKGTYGGIYLWEDEATMERFRGSDLAQTIAESYAVDGTPRVETFEVVSILRREGGVVVAGS